VDSGSRLVLAFAQETEEPGPAAVAESTSTLEELERLQKLRDGGILDEAEITPMKSRILGLTTAT
jgi:hypothetical protein